MAATKELRGNAIPNYARRAFFRGAIPCVLAEAAEDDRMMRRARAGWREFDEIADVIYPNWRGGASGQHFPIYNDFRVGLLELVEDGTIDYRKNDTGWEWWRLAEDDEGGGAWIARS